MSQAVEPGRLFLQATCVAVEDRGVLLRGPSGAGKSDLALRLIDGGARLIADDGVDIARRGQSLVAAWPRQADSTLLGLIEVRGLGLRPVPHRAEAPLALLIDLLPDAPIERLPEAASESVLGLSLPLLRLWAFEASAAAKVRLAVRSLDRVIIAPP